MMRNFINWARIRCSERIACCCSVLIATKCAPGCWTAVQIASGAADTVPYITVTNLARALREIQERNVWVIGADGEAKRDLYDVDQSGVIAWVLGAEETGLRRLTGETCDELVRIPMLGTVESLNVSVASGICLFEARRQRGLKKK